MGKHDTSFSSITYYSNVSSTQSDKGVSNIWPKMSMSRTKSPVFKVGPFLYRIICCSEGLNTKQIGISNALKFRFPMVRYLPPYLIPREVSTWRPFCSNFSMVGQNGRHFVQNTIWKLNRGLPLEFRMGSIFQPPTVFHFAKGSLQ